MGSFERVTGTFCPVMIDIIVVVLVEVLVDVVGTVVVDVEVLVDVVVDVLVEVLVDVVVEVVDALTVSVFEVPEPVSPGPSDRETVNMQFDVVPVGDEV